MTSIRLLRWSSCNGVGGRSKRLAELLASGEERSHQSPTEDPSQRKRVFQTIDPPDPSPTLAFVWRIRFQRGTIVPMMHILFMARLWDSLRAALHEFKMSRTMRKSNSRFRVVEIRKSERRRLSSSGCGPRLSRRRNQVKWLFRRRGGGSSVDGGPKSPNVNASWGSASEEEDEEEDIQGKEEEQNTQDKEEEESIVKRTSSRPINWSRWKDIEIGEFSSRVYFRKTTSFGLTSSRSMGEFRTMQWETGFLATSSSARESEVRLHPGGSSAPTTSGFENRGWANRLNNDSPQLVQPVRGKLTTLSSFLRTLSDRYARRTGKRTPLHERSSKKDRPVLTSSLSAAPVVMQPEYQRTTSSASKISDDVPMRRYDNPFQDFLRRSYAERNSRFPQEEERER